MDAESYMGVQQSMNDPYGLVCLVSTLPAVMWIALSVHFWIAKTSTGILCDNHSACLSARCIVDMS